MTYLLLSILAAWTLWVFYVAVMRLKQVREAGGLIANLRDVSNGVNGQNKKAARKDNKCGILGVSKCHGGWRADINVGGKKRWFGPFSSPEEARDKYIQEKRLHHEGNTL